MFTKLLTVALLAAPFTAFAGQTSPEHATVGVTGGLLPVAGVGGTVSSDRFHVAADAGIGGLPFVVSEPWARAGARAACMGDSRPGSRRTGTWWPRSWRRRSA